MKKVFFLILILVSGILAAQSQQVTILVKDAVSGETVPYANVCSETVENHYKKYQITDKDGQVTLPLQEKTIVSISCLGFENITDTIPVGTKEKIYKLPLSYHELSAVVVTGQYKPVSVDKSIYDIKLIGKDHVENKAANNLAEVLSDELAIRLSNDPSTGTSLNLQGISGENIKILVDGVPVIGRLDGNIDLTQLNLDNVSHIEVVEGPMSVIYGSNALGGVINIITNKNLAEKYKTVLNSYYESVGTYNFNFVTSVKQEKHTFELTGGRNFFSGFDLENATRTKEWKPKEQYHAGLTYFYTDVNTKIRFNSDLFREKLLNRNEPFLQTDTAWVRAAGKDSLTYLKKYKANNTWFRTIRFNNSIEVTRSFGYHSNFNLLAAYSYYFREKLNNLIDLSDLSERLTTASSDHDTSVFDAFMVRGVYSFLNEDRHLNAQVGFDINYETAEGNRIENSKEDIGDYAAFASVMWRPSEYFTFQPGLRVAYNTRYNAPLTPSINVMYKLGKTTLRASWARGFRSPSLKELYLYFYDSNHQIEGNEDLQAERSHNFTLSANQNLTYDRFKFLFNIKSYYNLIEDKISLVQADPENALHYRNENTGNFQSIGYEFFGTVYHGTRLKFKAGVARIGRKDEAYENKEFIYSNNLNGNANINFLKNTAKLSVFYKFTGKYPVYLYDDSDKVVLGHVNSFHNLDAGISKKFWNNRIVVSVGIKNILDNKEIKGVGISSSSAHGTSDGVSSLVGWGRTYHAGLKLNFAKY